MMKLHFKTIKISLSQTHIIKTVSKELKYVQGHKHVMLARKKGIPKKKKMPKEQKKSLKPLAEGGNIRGQINLPGQKMPEL